jgi:alpha-L-rhamnosidase
MAAKSCEPLFFDKARAIWLNGNSREMNIQAGFRTVIKATAGSAYDILITASTFYRLWVNGQFVMFGPARAAHGYLRVDCVSITDFIVDGDNLIAIEVAGYNCICLYHKCLESFLQAEIRENGKVIRYTGDNEFMGYRLDTRHQKVVRLSFQRDFTEIYSYDNKKAITHWHKSLKASLYPYPVEIINHNCQFIPREVALPDFEKTRPVARIQAGWMKPVSHPEGYMYPVKNFFNCPLSQKIEPSAFSLTEIPDNPYYRLLDYEMSPSFKGRKSRGIFGQSIKGGGYVVYDMGRILTGFIGSKLLITQDSEVIFIFDEKLVDDRMAHMPYWPAINVVKYNLKASSEPYDLLTFEPYAFRYIAVIIFSGEGSLMDLHIREYAYPDCNNMLLSASDDRVLKIVDAGRENYRQHVLDVLMNNSNRERAAFLYESYFTGQALPFYSGDIRPEKTHLENFIHPSSFPSMNRWVLPTCYPSDTMLHMPHYSMWFVLQLKEYLERSGNTDLSMFRRIVPDLVGHLEHFINEDGLLENAYCDWWEWSDANSFTGGVHYPTNMLFAKTLQVASELFGVPDYSKRANYIHRKIIEQSFDGSYFIDNAVRNSKGKLIKSDNRSEFCQHMAFFAGTANPDDARFTPLVRSLLYEMGPMNEDSVSEVLNYSDTHFPLKPRKSDRWKAYLVPLGLSYGYLIRILLLLQWRKYKLVLEECFNTFYPMTLMTGTIWEHKSMLCTVNNIPGYSSCGLIQGCASMVGAAIVRAVMGVQKIDNKNMSVTLDFSEIPIEHARLVLGTAYGPITVEREYKKNGPYIVHYSIPRAYKENLLPPSGWFQISSEYTY